MSPEDLRWKINTMVDILRADLKKVDAKDPTTQQMGQLLMAGVEILGEAVIDLKRIAIAMERRNER